LVRTIFYLTLLWFQQLPVMLKGTRDSLSNFRSQHTGFPAGDVWSEDNRARAMKKPLPGPDHQKKYKLWKQFFFLN